jgi:hypothetical protein
MAYPQVADIATSSETGNVYTHTINYPANISAGDLLLCFFATDGDNTITDWDVTDDWTQMLSVSNGTAASLHIAWRKADGNEGSNFNVTTSESEQSAHIVFRITEAIDPLIQAPEVSSTVGNSATPSPPLLTPTGSSKQYLWIAAEGNDDNDAATAYPWLVSPNNTSKISTTGSGTCHVAISTAEATVDALDPGSFTLGAGEQWVACTIAVYPIPAVGYSRNIDDGMAPIDATDRAVGRLRVVDDIIMPSDSATRKTRAVRELADALAPTDAPITGAIDKRALSVWTEGWFQTDGLVPNRVEVWTDGWWELFGVGELYEVEIDDTVQPYGTPEFTGGTPTLGGQLSVWTEGWFQADGQVPNNNEVWTDGWWKEPISGFFLKIADIFANITHSIVTKGGQLQVYIYDTMVVAKQTLLWVDWTLYIKDNLPAFIEDLVVTKGAKFMTYVYETMNSVDELFATIPTAIRHIVDSIAPAGILKRRGAFPRSITDAAGIADLMNRVRTRFGKIADSMAPGDLIQQAQAYIVHLIVDLEEGLSDTIKRTMAATRGVTDLLAPSGIITHLEAWLRQVADTLAPSDIMQVITALIAQIADTLIPTDMLVAFKTFVRNVADSIAPVDLVSHIQTWLRKAIDSTAPSDALKRIGQWARKIAEQSGITDVIERTLGGEWLKTIANTLAGADVVKRTATFTRSLADTAAPTELAKTASAFLRKMADTAVATALVSTFGALLTTMADILAPTDAIDKVKGFLRSAIESISPSDALKTASAFLRKLAVQMAPAGVRAVMGVFLRKLEDTEPPTDVIKRSGSLLKRLADSTGITGVLARILNYIARPNKARFNAVSSNELHFDAVSTEEIHYTTEG